MNDNTRIIQAPEMHFSPKNFKSCMYALGEVEREAKRLYLFGNKVYVVFAGDLWDQAQQATERSGLSAFMALMRKLAESAIVVMQYGTRSMHDLEGSYDVFQGNENIFVLDRSQNTYFDNDVAIFSFEEPQLSEFSQVPQPDLWDAIHAHEKALCVSASEFFDSRPGQFPVIMGHGTVLCNATIGNAAVVFGNFHITEADLAATTASLALWGHLHQPYEFTSIRGGYARSLAHTYKDSGFIPGFNVFDGTNEKVFIPLVELPARYSVGVAVSDTGDISIEYNSAISAMAASHRVIVRADISIPKALNDSAHRSAVIDAVKAKYANAEHDNPRIVQREENKTRNADIGDHLSYRDMYLKVYPGATESDLVVQDELERQDRIDGVIPTKKNIALKSIKVRGYVPFQNGMGSEELDINLDSFGAAVVGIVAPGGYGKSSLGDLVYPHPECLSQPESKAELFYLPESYIKQEFEVDGKHVICEIRGNGEKKTAIYFCSVDGVEQCKKNVRDYKEVVNALFGSLHEYALTVSRTQFKFPRIVDSKNLNPDVKYARNRDMKDLYSHFCGSDKSKTSARCKEQGDSFSNTANALAEKAKGVQSGIDKIASEVGDIEYMRINRDSLVEKIATARRDIETIIVDGNAAAADIEKAKVAVATTESEKLKKIADAVKTASLRNEMDSIKAKIETKSAIMAALERNKLAIDADSMARASNLSIAEAVNRNSEKTNAFTSATNVWNAKLASEQAKVNASNQALLDEWSKLDDESRSVYAEKWRKNSEAIKEWDIEDRRVNEEYVSRVMAHKGHSSALTRDKADLEAAIERNSHSCPQCGYISKESATAIAEASVKLAAVLAEIDSLRDPDMPTMRYDRPLPMDNYKAAEKPVLAPVPQTIDDPKPEPPGLGPVPQWKMVMSDSERESVVLAISDAAAAPELMAEYASAMERISLEMANLEKIEYSIDDNAASKLESAEGRKRLLGTAYQALMQGIRADEVELSELNTKIAAAEQVSENIASLTAELSRMEEEKEAAEATANSWYKYQAAWGRNGIPARFVEIEAPIIDSIANEILAMFYPKLFIETCTTKIDSVGEVADTFDVMVYNSEQGTKQALYSLSGEETNFVLSAMFHAFRQRYSENTGRHIGFIFEDEQDDHTSLSMQPNYWNMIQYQQSVDGKLRLCTSHSAEFPNRMENTIDLEAMGSR